MNQPKVILIVLDGWGYSEIKRGNAILQAKKPNFDRLWSEYPHTLISASGEEVGLPWGEIGSSEVGHLAMGSGQIIYQELPRVSKAIRDGDFFRNPVLLDALNYAKTHKSNLHLIGLVSSGGVHSHIDHLYALLELLKRKKNRQPSYIHMFTDGRDTPPKVAASYVEKVENKIKVLKLQTQIASVIGRYYAMDRDSHWERTLSAYNCLVAGQGEKADSATEAVQNAYQRDETDEFIKPTVIYGKKQINGFWQNLAQQNSTDKIKPVGPIEENDALIFFNFRSERMRQLIETFLFPQPNYKDKILRKNIFVSTLTEYDKTVPVNVAFPPDGIKNSLAKILSEKNLTQLHLAETEKYAHATYFFDGGHSDPYPGEEWKIIHSPKVATYDEKPEMSASEITDELAKKLSNKNYDFVLINFANADMVGHTGNLAAGIKAVETIDQQLGKITQLFPDSNILITADHGNAEEMVDKNGGINTNHSLAPVPLILVGKNFRKSQPNDSVPSPSGILADITPTILHLLDIQKAPEMIGDDLTNSLV